jgi:hypothetical protein
MSFASGNKLKGCGVVSGGTVVKEEVSVDGVLQKNGTMHA